MHIYDQMPSAERNTILAALRFYQACGLFDPAKRPLYIDDIATNGGTAVPLDEAEIDSLCERINVPTPDLEASYEVASLCVLDLREMVDGLIEAAEEDGDEGEVARLRRLTDRHLADAAYDVARKADVEIGHLQDWALTKAQAYADEDEAKSLHPHR